ncbi:serine/threonine protein kinase [Methylomicrobium agile]|uniref:serine/threonine protein kinase n=1 Tax=Methylomicrobium agile TaxID=39774 RepID=UPI0006912420|nr:serine/threonine-protein kinase [Methylomicrobium agile]
MNLDKNPENRVCPGCGTENPLVALAQRDYRCSQCNLEMAHLDVAANGVIRGVFGWLREVGSTIGERYRVVAVLGKGGFGATYLVEDLRLNAKRRAIKEVPELLFDEYETTLLSRLNHPSIPDIIDRSVADGMVYLVLEFGGSKTLSSERKQYPGRIPLDILLPWMRQLCEVLIYLHSQKPPIIHRDLKPDNVLLDENGRIMLIDFGIAKESTPSTMTRTIGRAATHGFSPPEQAMGTGTDERSDIYALSATFYALLTGQNPPAAHERVAGKDLIAPSQLAPGVPPLLEAAILRALNLNVNLRQQTMQEFGQTLAAIDPGMPGPATQSAQYTDRTVLVSRRTGATGLHPPSLKLPSEPVSLTLPKSAPSAAIPPAHIATDSNRKALWLMAGVSFALAATLAIAYFLWPAAKDESTRIAGTQAPGQTLDLLPPLPQLPVAVQPTAEPEKATPTPVPAPSTSVAAIMPTPTPGGSAAAAFEEELKKKGGSPEIKPIPGPSSQAENTLYRTREASTPKNIAAAPKPKPVVKRKEPTRQVAKRNSGGNNDSWLDDFSSSGVRVK